MAIHAFFIIISVGIVLVLKSLLSRISRRQMHRNTAQELKIMFNWFWDGTPEDELYAWYKVRTVLKQREGGDRQKKMAMVDRKIDSIKKEAIQGNYSVNEKGQLVPTTDSKASLPEM